MKKNKLKKVFIFLFSFLFIASATVAGGVLLSGSSYSVPVSESSGEEIQDNENLTNVTANATEPLNDGNWTDSGNYDTTFAGGTGTESDPYLISTARQLAGLAYWTNISTSTTYNGSGVYYRQTADIDLSAYWWDAIGTNASSTYYFQGHYDGDGHTVSGIYTQPGSSTTYNYQGLFGYVRGTSSTNRAEISNVGVINSNIQGYKYVGGIAGYSYYANITNCYNTSSVTGSYNYVGGVVGYNASSTVSNSYNTGDVTSTYTGTYAYVGGVAGYNYNSTVTNSYNTGTVTGSGSYVGGIVGYNYYSIVTNSYNIGSVTGVSVVGGVVGYSGSSSTVSNSYNTGTVTGSSYVGGVVGRNSSSTVLNCYYGGNCASIIGGINGADVDGQAEYWDTIATDAKTESWYGSSSTVTWNSSYPWDFTDTWGITQYANDGYPYLLGVGNIAPDNTDLMWTDSAVTTRDTDFEGSGTASDPYLISSAEELAGLAYNVNNGTNYSGTYFKQTADIDVSAYWWDAIGTYTSSSNYNEFAGHYDGDGYTVSGVFTKAGSSTTYNYQGLFGHVRGASSTDRAEISNVGVIDSNIQGYGYVAGIAGFARYTNIANCYNTGSVTSSSSYVGGVVGYNSSSSTVSNSYNTGEVTGSGYVGGVVGYNYSSTVSNSYNTGSVTGSGSYVGGIVGYNYSSSTVSNSYNTGTVTGSSSVGGVVGRNYSSSTVTNSYNIGSVTGSSGYVGGVVGYSYSSSTVSNSYNTGSVTGVSGVGGVVGGNNSSTVSYCYYGGGCASSVGGINSADVDGQAEYLGTITTDAKTSSWYTSTSGNWNSEYPWDFTYVWALDSSVNDGYPHFKEITVTYHSNFGDDETIEKAYYASSVDILSSDTFTREHYEIASWNTNQTGTGTSYTPGETYQIATDINLYAQWQGVLYNITLNHGNGNTNNVFYVRFDTGFYSDSGATTEITSITSFMSLPTMNGYSFGGYYTGENGEGYQVIDEEGNIVVSNTFFTGNTTIYAYWTVNVPAYYDSTNGYWYIEYGKMPQTKVTDSGVINALNGDSTLTDSDGVTISPNVYYFAGSMFSAKIYNGNEYCNFQGNWYLVEPIKWRLDTDLASNSTEYVTTDTLAVMDTIVYVGAYSQTALEQNQGYVSANNGAFSSVQYFLNNFNINDKSYLVDFSANSQHFTTTGPNGNESSTSSIFLSSQDEISNIYGNYECEFSDLVTDYLNSPYGNGEYYFLRDLGNNLNNVVVSTESGGITYQRPTYILGMRLTIKVTEFVCV